MSVSDQTIKIFDLKRECGLRTYNMQKNLEGLQLIHNDKFIVAIYEDQIVILDFWTGLEIYSKFGKFTKSTMLTPDGCYIFYKDGNDLVIHDFLTPKITHQGLPIAPINSCCQSSYTQFYLGLIIQQQSRLRQKNIKI